MSSHYTRDSMHPRPSSAPGDGSSSDYSRDSGLPHPSPTRPVSSQSRTGPDEMPGGSWSPSHTRPAYEDSSSGYYTPPLYPTMTPPNEDDRACMRLKRQEQCIQKHLGDLGLRCPLSTIHQTVRKFGLSRTDGGQPADCADDPSTSPWSLKDCPDWHSLWNTVSKPCMTSLTRARHSHPQQCSHYAEFVKCASFVMKVNHYHCSEDMVRRMALNNYWYLGQGRSPSDRSSYPPTPSTLPTHHPVTSDYDSSHHSRPSSDHSDKKSDMYTGSGHYDKGSDMYRGSSMYSATPDLFSSSSDSYHMTDHPPHSSGGYGDPGDSFTLSLPFVCRDYKVPSLVDMEKTEACANPDAFQYILRYHCADDMEPSSSRDHDHRSSHYDDMSSHYTRHSMRPRPSSSYDDMPSHYTRDSMRPRPSSSYDDMSSQYTRDSMHPRPSSSYDDMSSHYTRDSMRSRPSTSYDDMSSHYTRDSMRPRPSSSYDMSSHYTRDSMHPRPSSAPGDGGSSDNSRDSGLPRPSPTRPVSSQSRTGPGDMPGGSWSPSHTRPAYEDSSSGYYTPPLYPTMTPPSDDDRPCMRLKRQEQCIQKHLGDLGLRCPLSTIHQTVRKFGLSRTDGGQPVDCADDDCPDPNNKRGRTLFTSERNDPSTSPRPLKDCPDWHSMWNTVSEPCMASLTRARHPHPQQCSHYAAFVKCASVVMKVNHYHCSEDMVRRMALNNYWYLGQGRSPSDRSSSLPTPSTLPTRHPVTSDYDSSHHSRPSSDHSRRSESSPMDGYSPTLHPSSSGDQSTSGPFSTSTGDRLSDSYSHSDSHSDRSSEDYNRNSYLYSSSDYFDKDSDMYRDSSMYGSTTPDLYSSSSDSYDMTDRPPQSSGGYGDPGDSFTLSLPFVCRDYKVPPLVDMEKTEACANPDAYQYILRYHCADDMEPSSSRDHDHRSSHYDDMPSHYTRDSMRSRPSSSYDDMSSHYTRDSMRSRPSSSYDDMSSHYTRDSMRSRPSSSYDDMSSHYTRDSMRSRPSSSYDDMSSHYTRDSMRPRPSSSYDDMSSHYTRDSMHPRPSSAPGDGSSLDSGLPRPSPTRPVSSQSRTGPGDMSGGSWPPSHTRPAYEDSSSGYFTPPLYPTMIPPSDVASACRRLKHQQQCIQRHLGDLGLRCTLSVISETADKFRLSLTGDRTLACREKPGQCPPSGEVGITLHECGTDYDCQDSRKCCPVGGGAGYVCREPVSRAEP